MNVRSLKARLRRIERSSGGGGSDQFINSLTYEQLDALIQVLWAAIEAAEAGEELSDDEALSILMDSLDCEDREARYLWRCLNDLPPNPEHGRLSEEELDEMLDNVQQECDRLEAEHNGDAA